MVVPPEEGEADIVAEAKASVDKIIEESSEAHALGVKCKQLAFSDQLCTALQSHSLFMETTLRIMLKSTVKYCPSDLGECA